MNDKKNIIINADDYGLAECINRGIVHACEKKAVTSVSILATGKYFEQGAAAMTKLAHIGKGVHLCLTDERSVLPAHLVPSLVTKEGLFYSHPQLLWRLFREKISLTEVYAEWKAQIEKCMAAGITVTHLDTHNHLHLFESFYKVLVHVAEEYGIPAIRQIRPPCSSLRDFSFRNLIKLYFSLVQRRGYGSLDARGIMHPDAILGYYNNGDLTEASLSRCIAQAKPGAITELICHPGYEDASALNQYGYWNYHWEQELSTLLAVVPKAVKEDASINLINFAGLQRTDNGNVPKPASLSVVIPAYNEYENIQKEIRILQRFLDKRLDDYEILVVDDRSSDRTAEVAQQLLSAGKGRLVPNQGNKGFGAALKFGLTLAKKEWVFYIDADYPAYIGNLTEAFKYINDYDMIIGYRTNSLDEGLSRFCYRLVYRFLINTLFKLRFKDINFAFKLVKKSVLDSLRIESENSFVDAEILIRAHARGVRVKEIPIDGLDRTFGASHLTNVSNIATLLTYLIRFYFRNKR